MSSKELSDRGQQVLKALIQNYITAGEPVGSKTLVQEAGLPVSSATVRNVMSDLEDKGFIYSVHTSSGRVPTPKGYRFFIDSLLTMQPLASPAIESLKAELNPDKSAKELVESASSLLSAITQQAGVVTLPKQEVAQLRQVEFCRCLVTACWSFWC